MLNPHLQAAPRSPTGEVRLTPAGMGGNGATGRIRPAIGASSGRELIEGGYARDVELAAALDVSTHVPRYDGVAFLDDKAS